MATKRQKLWTAALKNHALTFWFKTKSHLVGDLVHGFEIFNQDFLKISIKIWMEKILPEPMPEKSGTNEI